MTHKDLGQGRTSYSSLAMMAMRNQQARRGVKGGGGVRLQLLGADVDVVDVWIVERESMRVSGDRCSSRVEVPLTSNGVLGASVPKG